MQQTLAKVKNLEKFIQRHGEDSVISQSITKMLDYKIQKYDAEISRLNKDLKKCERKYKKDSTVFFDEFSKGKLGGEYAFSENPFKKPLIMVTAGSTFYVNGHIKPFYGRMVEGISPAKPEVVQYGYAFAVPIRLEGLN